ncbi:S1 family peptidase [Streptomyces sp. URMC 123]|uniref:S1 family peptidase n=1 Tax=Streptomyces sp. URMC 123 TaxID=3423403 RepID=UPI003F195FF0
MKHRRMSRRRPAGPLAAGAAVVLGLALPLALATTGAGPMPHPNAELAEARRTLAERAAVPGTSWSVDPRIGKVVVTADRTVGGERLARLERVVAGLGGRAVLRRTPGEFTAFLAGGDGVHSGAGRCSVGFNVTAGGRSGFLTAGHCGRRGSAWSPRPGSAPVGVMTVSGFPGDDFGLVTYADRGERPSAVTLHGRGVQPIARAGEAALGQRVRSSGATSGVREGVVTGLGETVNYPQGSVSGLIKTSICAGPGDSGGPLFAGDTALGLVSGGVGDCSSGGTTFFQPVTEALREVGARIG